MRTKPIHAGGETSAEANARASRSVRRLTDTRTTLGARHRSGNWGDAVANALSQVIALRPRYCSSFSVVNPTMACGARRESSLSSAPASSRCTEML